MQIERNPWLGGYRPQITVLSVLCPQLNLLNPPPSPAPKKFLGTPLIPQAKASLSRTELCHKGKIFILLVTRNDVRIP
jgi:hypothetical protein